MIGKHHSLAKFVIYPLSALLLATLISALSGQRAVLAQSGVSQGADDEIVFIDGNGVVRVLDPYQEAGAQQVSFSSPDDDWEAAALGDFNGDGDMEIVAVGGGDEDDDDDDGKLAIWDPVPAEGGGPIELYRRSIDGRARLVAAGNFDVNVNGDEILFSYFLQDEAQAPGKDELFRTTIIKGTTANPDGRQWTNHIERKDDGNEWNYVTVGNIDNAGSDEVILLDEEGGEVNLYRIDDGFTRIWGDSASDDPYRGVSFGDFYQGGFPEIAVSRNRDIRNTFVYRYDEENDTLEGDFPGWDSFFRPYPRFLWAADMDGNDEDELFFLRRDQDPRLIGLNYPPKRSVLEASLNNDDFRVGVGGDFDGDGREEIAIANDEKILLYMEIETGNRTPIEYGFTTDRRSLAAGDMDSAGGVVGNPTLGLARIGGNGEIESTISVSLAAGESQPAAVGYYIVNSGSEASIVLEVSAPAQPDWFNFRTDINVSGEVDAGTILAALYPSFNAAGLFPGVYEASLIIRDASPNSEVTNNPLRVPVILTVEPAALIPVPSSAQFIYAPCTDDLAERERVIRLGGFQGLVYNAAVIETPTIEAALAQLDGEAIGARIAKDGAVFLIDAAGNESKLAIPAAAWDAPSDALTKRTDGTLDVDEVLIDWPSGAPWVTASSEDGVIPDLLTITIDPNETTGALREAALVLVADRRGGNPPASVHIVPIQYLCAAGQIHLPIIVR